jgi:hypothetical protein
MHGRSKYRLHVVLIEGDKVNHGIPAARKDGLELIWPPPPIHLPVRNCVAKGIGRLATVANGHDVAGIEECAYSSSADE